MAVQVIKAFVRILALTAVDVDARELVAAAEVATVLIEDLTESSSSSGPPKPLRQLNQGSFAVEKNNIIIHNDEEDSPVAAFSIHRDGPNEESRNGRLLPSTKAAARERVLKSWVQRFWEKYNQLGRITPNPTKEPTPKPTPRPTPRPRRTRKPTPLPTKLVTAPPTQMPDSLTESPTTTKPTPIPTIQLEPPISSPQPTASVSDMPSGLPSHNPSSSISPTFEASAFPSMSNMPSILPSTSPSLMPTDLPSGVPSLHPTKSNVPSALPSQLPTASFSPTYTMYPSADPSMRPSISTLPSFQPSLSPTESKKPSGRPSHSPTATGSPTESTAPSDAPSHLPTTTVSPTATMDPSVDPSLAPSTRPSLLIRPSLSPTESTLPSQAPSASLQPSVAPSTMFGKICEDFGVCYSSLNSDYDPTCTCSETAEFNDAVCYDGIERCIDGGSNCAFARATHRYGLANEFMGSWTSYKFRDEAGVGLEISMWSSPIDISGDPCFLLVDNVSCAQCSFTDCEGQLLGFVADCSNHGYGSINSCQGTAESEEFIFFFERPDFHLDCRESELQTSSPTNPPTTVPPTTSYTPTEQSKTPSTPPTFQPVSDSPTKSPSPSENPSLSILPTSSTLHPSDVPSISILPSISHPPSLDFNTLCNDFGECYRSINEDHNPICNCIEYSEYNDALCYDTIEMCINGGSNCAYQRVAPRFDLLGDYLGSWTSYKFRGERESLIAMWLSLDSKPGDSCFLQVDDVDCIHCSFSSCADQTLGFVADCTNHNYGNIDSCSETTTFAEFEFFVDMRDFYLECEA